MGSVARQPLQGQRPAQGLALSSRATHIAPAPRRSAGPARRGRYSAVAMGLHWAIASLLLTNLALGFFGASLDGADKLFVISGIHKPIGMTVLVLSIARAIWRLLHRPPPYSAAVGPLQRRVAGAVHGLLYGLMIGLPISGWWMSSALPARHAFTYFGLFPLPFLPVPQAMWIAVAADQVHMTLGWAVVCAIALHVTAALKHQFFDRDDVMARMAFWMADRNA